MAWIGINIGRGRMWMVHKAIIDNSKDELYFQGHSFLYYEHRRHVLSARRFMRSMGFTRYCPYYNYVHIPYRERFNKPTPPNYCNVGGKYFGYVPYEKLHRIEVQRRYWITYDGSKHEEIYAQDYFRTYYNNEPFMQGVENYHFKSRIAVKEGLSRRLSRVNIYRYL